MSKRLVVALSGGVGGAKLALGLSRILPADELLVVANTGDDFEHLGLSISPDIDTLTYTLAGIDQSNVGSHGDPQRALLLPVDPDGSAAILRKRLSQRFGVPVAVIIRDSFGRAWRRGTCGVAIGAAGLPSLMDLRGSPDLFGRELQVSITGHADEIAAAASLVMGQGAEGQPVVIVRGLTWRGPDNAASELVRPAAEDMFR